MNVNKVTIWATIALSLVSWASAQIPVYLTPDIGSTPHKSVTQKELNAQNPQPVLDEEQAAQGWKWVDLPGTYVGHVESAQVTKALKVQASTLVYAAPDAESTVLTVLQDTDEHTVNTSSEDWAEVTFSKSITVYYLDSVQAPVATGLNAPIAEQAPTAMPPSSTTPVIVEEPENEIQELDVFTSDDPELTGVGEELTKSFKPPSDILRTYSGVFGLTKTGIFNRKPITAAELRAPDGEKRIAYLHLDNCVMHLPMSAFPGKLVSVQAVVMEGNWNKDTVLDVRNIRILY